MNCPHCQAPNADDARFCGTCGRASSSTEPTSDPSLAAPQMMIGRVIAGRYRIQDKLGEGGMGAVFKAEQISLKRTVAVKLLRPEMASSQLLLRRFNAEAEAVAKLSHPNTVNIYDFGQDTDGALFIAMEFIEGQSLSHVIHREAPLSLRRALSIALQVAASLTDAHSRSIIHRDLKPDNVMLQQRGREKDIVRVLDFGIAKLRDENRQSQLAMTQAGDMLGTPQYMAPEQIRAETIDGRTDIYALGCLLYEMITARLPYEAPTIMSLLSKHLLEVTVPPSQRRPDLALPPAIDHLILAAMAKDPKVRPATMEVFGEQLAELLASLPVDTSQSTAQRSAPSAFLPVVATPAAYSALSPPGAVAVPSYATHGPQMPAHPAFAPPTAPPPGPPLPTQNTRGGGSNKALWIVLAALLLAGGGVGIVMAMRSTSSGQTAETGSDSAGSAEPIAPVVPTVPTVPTPSNLGSADPWGGGGSIDLQKIEEAAEEEVDEVDVPEPQAYGGTGKMPPECEQLTKMIARLSTCSKLTPEMKLAFKQAADQMRTSYAAGLPDSVRAEVAESCRTATSSYDQVFQAYGCSK